jgi:hypothetical protein
MRVVPIASLDNAGAAAPHQAELPPQGEQRFGPLLEAAAAAPAANAPLAVRSSRILAAPPLMTAQSPPAANPHKAAAAYQQQAEPQEAVSQMSDIQRYKDDQLLRNPGGDHYFLDQKQVIADPPGQKSFLGRLGKDLSGSFGNIKNFFGNLLFGSKFCYRDQHSQIQEATRRGVLGSLVDFVKDLGSALTLGKWRPDGAKEPHGVLERLGFAVSKAKEAFAIDLFHGVCGGVNRMGGNLVLAGWNLMEVAPDATLGNLPPGKKLTTTLFDNGQVLVEYLTDILPAGEAWLRVHAPSVKQRKFPILYNLGLPEHYHGDARWEHISNTPFRKTIETVGSLLADVAMVGTIGPVKFLSEDSHKRIVP